MAARTRTRAASACTSTPARPTAGKPSARPGRKHVCWTPCPPGCTEHGGKCPRFCPPGCARHAMACPQRKGGWKFTRPKGKRKRSVPIPVQLVPPLRQHFADQDAEKVAAGARWQDWGLVWCEPDGRPIDPHDDWDEWKALLAEAGITKDARLHDARHTSGTLLGEQHVDLHVIQRILGHAHVRDTGSRESTTGLRSQGVAWSSPAGPGGGVEKRSGEGP